MALSDASFGDEMRLALDEGDVALPVVTDGEDEAEYDKCLLDDVESMDVIYRTAGAGPLVLPPVRDGSSEMGSQNVDEGEERLDDRDLETQGSIHSTLTSKTQKVKELKREYAEVIRATNEASPFDVLNSKHAEINSLVDDEAKLESIAMYNAISTIFEKCRHNAQTRKFVGDLFSNTQAYYDHKERKKGLKYQVNPTPHASQHAPRFPARIRSRPRVSLSLLSHTLRRFRYSRSSGMGKRWQTFRQSRRNALDKRTTKSIERAQQKSITSQ